jgi:hypothetical protein
MINAPLMSLFDYILFHLVNNGLMATKHCTYSIKTDANAIALLDYEFGTIWV